MWNKQPSFHTVLQAHPLGPAQLADGLHQLMRVVGVRHAHRWTEFARVDARPSHDNARPVVAAAGGPRLCERDDDQPAASVVRIVLEREGRVVRQDGRVQLAVEDRLYLG